jgi:hypothetical protein
MSRSIGYMPLETRTARSRLAPRDKPYYAQVEPGVHVGYRKSKTDGSGRWVVRFYDDTPRASGSPYTARTIGIADDFSDADGVAVPVQRYCSIAAFCRFGMLLRLVIAARLLCRRQLNYNGPLCKL